MNGDSWLTSVDAMMLLKAVTCGAGPTPMPRPPMPIYLNEYAMIPKTPTICAGEALNWINIRKAPMITYTLVSENGLWENQSISYGKKFRYTFDTPGNYSYYCLGYGNAMRGTVTVT